MLEREVGVRGLGSLTSLTFDLAFYLGIRSLRYLRTRAVSFYFIDLLKIFAANVLSA